MMERGRIDLSELKKSSMNSNVELLTKHKPCDGNDHCTNEQSNDAQLEHSYEENANMKSDFQDKIPRSSSDGCCVNKLLPFVN
jgi:hypothetical protein